MLVLIEESFHNSFPTIQVGDYVFEIRESPKPLRAIADGNFQVVSKYKHQEASPGQGLRLGDESAHREALAHLVVPDKLLTLHF